ncbi:aspartate racemase [Sodiomyces alkalinus F11]|uniref:Aspartate racemase n=1 Tax=Sodiomyces alkalinus (strain CBS 110278 / VKM F-3762 / F11) TaxID=1314773 RepID=A0A3N2Q3T6_SODAK|nr:aspartate racemase [Sodiomyces alkalinus F11]ROT41295.1 aspartate racemase [Sodiomyces alkalinus F11]
MKTIGLLGGMSYHSTTIYYTQINAHVQRLRGGVNAASLILHSFNYADTSRLFAANDWDGIAAKFMAAAAHLEAAGADGIAIGCNIGHKVAPRLEAAVGLPVALLATKAVMDGDFITSRLAERAGVEVLLPRQEDRVAIDAAVFGELAVGKVTPEITGLITRVVDELVAQGAEAVVLACTDLQFVLTPENVKVPLLDTLEIHAKGLAEWSV